MKLTKNKKIAAVVLGAGALAAGGAGVAIAGGDDEGSSTPITGPDLAKAKESALAVVGPGKVTESEVGDEEGAYEVGITRARRPPGRGPSRRAVQRNRLERRAGFGG